MKKSMLKQIALAMALMLVLATGCGRSNDAAVAPKEGAADAAPPVVLPAENEENASTSDAEASDLPSAEPEQSDQEQLSEQPAAPDEIIAAAPDAPAQTPTIQPTPEAAPPIQAAPAPVEPAADEPEPAPELAEQPTEDAAAELVVRFGDEGAPFVLHLYDNDTAAAIARHVGTAAWRLPIYHYDDYDHWEVMQFYDIPSRYDIPSAAESITAESAGTVYYSEPNRIVLFFQDAEVSGEYTPVGYFDYSEAFVSAVENNPVLEGWSNKIVNISDGQ